MNILLVGNFGATNIESFYTKHLLNLGIDAKRLPIDKYNSRNIFIRALRYLLGGVYYLPLNINLIFVVLSGRIRVVWIFKGYQIYWFVLKYLSNNNIYLINYNPDHPYVRTFKSSGGPNLERSLKYYHLHLTYIKELNFHFLNNEGFKSYLLPFAYELSDDLYEKLLDLPEIIEVAFVGNPDADRVEVIKTLSMHGIKINLFGKDWDKWMGSSSFVEIHNDLSGYEFWSVLRRYRVQLNIFRRHNRDNHNMRFFEIPAVGGIQLMPNSKEITDYFEIGTEVFTYSDFDELDRKSVV